MTFRLSLFSSFTLLWSFSFAQADSSLKRTEIGVKLHYGTIYVHTKSVQNIAGARPYGLEVDIATQRSDEATWQRWKTYPRKGVSVAYWDLDHPILGKAITASYFLDPQYRINEKLQFKLRAAFGLVYATTPYSPTKNPANNSYRTHLNPYMQFSAGLGYSINNHLSISALANFQHFSNGGYNEPNRGVNWVTSSVGMFYSPNNYLPKYTAARQLPPKSKVRIDAGLMFVPKQGYSSYLDAQRTFLGGAFVQATKQVTRISGLTAGIEGYYNKIVEPPATAKNIGASPFLAGIHGGHVFLLGKVDFSQQIGTYLFNQTSYFNEIYYRWGLTYHVSKNLAAGLNLKSHWANADFADFRVFYKF